MRGGGVGRAVRGVGRVGGGLAGCVRDGGGGRWWGGGVGRGAGKDEADDIVGMRVQESLDVVVRDQVIGRGGDRPGVVHGEADTAEGAQH